MKFSMMKKLLCALLALLLALPALADENDEAEAALRFLTDAGIAVASHTLEKAYNNHTLTAALANGGTATYLLMRDTGFDPELETWTFTDAADEDVIRYIDAMLALLEKVARGESANEWSRPEYQVEEGLGLRNMRSTITNGLFSLERYGQLALDHMLHSLEQRQDAPYRNALRAQLASLLLGDLDMTPIAPEAGLAWYDALVLSVQDDLPPVTAACYEEDPFLIEVTELLLARARQEYASYTWGLDVDPEKTTVLVKLIAPTVQQEGDAATLFAVVYSHVYACYDGRRIRGLSGSSVPSRIDLVRKEGEWAIASITESEDGTRYAPSIRAFCQEDKALADSLMQAAGDPSDARDALRAYLATLGLTDPVME